MKLKIFKLEFQKTVHSIALNNLSHKNDVDEDVVVNDLDGRIELPQKIDFKQMLRSKICELEAKQTAEEFNKELRQLDSKYGHPTDQELRLRKISFISAGIAGGIMMSGVNVGVGACILFPVFIGISVLQNGLHISTTKTFTTKSLLIRFPLCLLGCCALTVIPALFCVGIDSLFTKKKLDKLQFERRKEYCHSLKLAHDKLNEKLKKYEFNLQDILSACGNKYHEEAHGWSFRLINSQIERPRLSVPLLQCLSSLKLNEARPLVSSWEKGLAFLFFKKNNQTSNIKIKFQGMMGVMNPDEYIKIKNCPPFGPNGLIIQNGKMTSQVNPTLHMQLKFKFTMDEDALLPPIPRNLFVLP